MPYDRVAELPRSVREHAQTIHHEAFNHAWQQYAHHPAHEEIAHPVAWSAVKRKYRKAGDQWVPKD